MLLLGNNAPLLCLHEVLARQPTTRVLRRAVIDLGLRADRRLLGTATHLHAARHTVILARRVIHAVAHRVAVLHYILDADFLHRKPWDLSR